MCENSIQISYYIDCLELGSILNYVWPSCVSKRFYKYVQALHEGIKQNDFINKHFNRYNNMS